MAEESTSINKNLQRSNTSLKLLFDRLQFDAAKSDISAAQVLKVVTVGPTYSIKALTVGHAFELCTSMH